MKPGDIVPAIVDDEAGEAIILATSRHRDRVNQLNAAGLLAEHMAQSLIGRDEDTGPLRAVLADRKPGRWYSITATEDHGCYSECDAEPGAWCSEGAGQAWVEVLSVTHGEVYDLLDNPDLVPAR